MVPHIAKQHTAFIVGINMPAAGSEQPCNEPLTIQPRIRKQHNCLKYAQAIVHSSNTT